MPLSTEKSERVFNSYLSHLHSYCDQHNDQKQSEEERAYVILDFQATLQNSSMVANLRQDMKQKP